MLQGFCRAGIDCMTDTSGSNRTEMYKEVVASLLALVIASNTLYAIDQALNTRAFSFANK